MEDIDDIVKRYEFNWNLIKGDEEREPLPKGLVSKIDWTKKLVNKIKSFPIEGNVINEAKELSLK